MKRDIDTWEFTQLPEWGGELPFRGAAMFLINYHRSEIGVNELPFKSTILEKKTNLCPRREM